MNGTLAAAYDLVLFDLDGVVYVGDEAVPGAAEAIRATVDGGTAVAYVTNNASRRGDEIVELLTSMGVPCRGEEVVTSGRAAAQLLATDLPPGATVLVVGAAALGEEVSAVGLNPVSRADDQPTAVVQGYGPEVGWHDLAEACVAIRAGARWVVTNTDATLPSLRGPLPGNGSLVAAVSHALGGRGPDLVVGKPSPALFEVAARRVQARRNLVVGDRLDTDIVGAHRAGMDSLLVLTGVSGAADGLGAASHERPTFLADDCRALSTADDQLRVPVWDVCAQAGAWLVSYADGRLVLRARGAGAGRSVDALRALAAGAWAHLDWTAIETGDDAAAEVIEVLGLGATPASMSSPRAALSLSSAAVGPTRPAGQPCSHD